MTNIVIISLKIIKCIMEHVEKNIRNIRELKDITQEHIATQLGISTRAYSRIETGETQLTINRLSDISRILGVQPQEILGFDKNLIFNNNPVSQKGGQYVAYNNTEIEQLKQLYEKLLAEKERVINLLQAQLNK